MSDLYMTADEVKTLYKNICRFRNEIFLVPIKPKDIDDDGNIIDFKYGDHLPDPYHLFMMNDLNHEAIDRFLAILQYNIPHYEYRESRGFGNESKREKIKNLILSVIYETRRKVLRLFK